MAAMAFREPNQVKWVGTRPGHNGEQVEKYNTATNGTAIVHTVTAGKTLYLVSAIIFPAAVNSGVGTVFIRDLLDAVWTYLVGMTGALNFGLIGQTLSLYHPIEVPEGYDICVLSGGAGLTVYGAIHGWEE